MTGKGVLIEVNEELVNESRSLLCLRDEVFIQMFMDLTQENNYYFATSLYFSLCS